MLQLRVKTDAVKPNLLKAFRNYSFPTVLSAFCRHQWGYSSEIAVFRHANIVIICNIANLLNARGLANAVLSPYSSDKNIKPCFEIP